MGHAFGKDYMDRMKRRHAKARTRAPKWALIDETVAMCGLSRKFVIRLLNGSCRHRTHLGRAPSCSPESRETLVRLWLAMGQMCHPPHSNAILLRQRCERTLRRLFMTQRP